MRPTQADLIKHLEQRGEASVKTALLNGDYKGEAYEIVKDWLSSKNYERAETRDDENLSIARKALRNSRWANIIAITAIIIAITAILVSVMIAWFPRK